MAQSRTTRKIQPTAKLSADNDATLELSSHKDARQKAVDLEAASKKKPAQSKSTTPQEASSRATSAPSSGTESENGDDTPTPKPSQKRRATVIDVSDDDDDANESDSAGNTKAPKVPAKKKKKTVTIDEPLDENGMHQDVNIQPIDDVEPDQPLNHTRPRADIDKFFARKPGVHGTKKFKRICIPCRDGIGCSKTHTEYVDEVSTIRRHMAKCHKTLYRDWAKKSNFNSMLPEDAEARRAPAAVNPLRQSTVNDHFKTATPGDKPEVYSSPLLKEAAYEWLLETNQVCIHISAFVQLNTAHNGTRLGQALYHVCQRLGIVHKIGHITCDNASNNMTMLQEFARCYKMKTSKMFDILEFHIRCLAHIINLATQALIGRRSKAKYITIDTADDDDVAVGNRDEVALVRAITVKARSSSQRKEMFKAIQEAENIKPLQLLLDMKVRWGSTYVMLQRAELRRDEIGKFILQLSMKETADREKRRKLSELQPSDDEWERVRQFNNLLEYADRAQHAFSADSRPTLHHALPAIEKLYAHWEKMSERSDYSTFHEAIEVALAKLNEYYEKTAKSTAHIVVMALDPRQKFKYFRKNWGHELAKQVEETVQKKFIERFNELASNPSTPSLPKSTSQTWNSKRRRTDHESDSDGESEQAVDPAHAWRAEWDAYLQTHEAVVKDANTVSWWGCNSHRYPTSASLARDYLAVMASSVSSERAFSAAGITISKRRNRLKGDIVEALQVLKCLIHHDLLFRRSALGADIEDEWEMCDDDHDPKASIEVVHESEMFSWDQYLQDEDDENDN